MKITAIRSRPIEVPFDEPIGTSIRRITGVAAPMARLDADEDSPGRR